MVHTQHRICSIAFQLLMVSYMGLIFIASVIPDIEATHRFLRIVPGNVQNMLHMPAYGLLAFLWILTLRTYGFTERSSILVATVISLAYGAGLELIQAYVPGRSCSVIDFIRDLVGAVVFVWLYRWMRPYALSIS